MKLHCLGTAGYHPNEQRQTSCYFLPASGIVLDAGTGIFRLPRLIETAELHILLSHAHLDHIAGLTFLLDVLYQRPVEKLVVWGQAEKLAAVRNQLFSEAIFPVSLDAQWRELGSQSDVQIGDCRVCWRDQEHPGGSLGFRLDWESSGKRLTYLTDTTGDTAPDAIEWAGESDLMMHECYFKEESSEWAIKTGHSWTGRVAEIADLSKPKQLLLTHINPLAEEPLDTLREVQDMLCERSGGHSTAISLAEDHLEVEF